MRCDAGMPVAYYAGFMRVVCVYYAAGMRVVWRGNASAMRVACVLESEYAR